MTEKRSLRDSGCPIAFGLDTFGDRWTLLVIREMLLKGKKTYGELQRIEEGISTHILADRLKHLESEGIIEKEQDAENRRSYLYTLTQKGRDLAPIIIEIVLWSGKHDSRPSALREVLHKIKTDRAGFTESLIKGRA